MAGESEVAQAKGEPIRVLLVEDEFVVSMTLKLQLEALGCTVVGTARSAGEGIELADRFGPDVVIMDIGLPGIDGVEATRTIMSQSPTNIIVVTAYGDHRVQDALDSGARLVLTKPILEEQLAQAIEVVTGRKLDAAEGAPAAEGSNTCQE
jgi:CheY-like chemotaxis protein